MASQSGLLAEQRRQLQRLEGQLGGGARTDRQVQLERGRLENHGLNGERALIHLVHFLGHVFER